MQYFVLLLFYSFLLSSDLDKWIENNSSIINTNKYMLEFHFTFDKKKKNVKQKKLHNLNFYSIAKDSSIIHVYDRYVLCFKDRWETINYKKKQKYIEPINIEFKELKNKISSIFTNKRHKVIKLSDKKYYLSLDDYFINMNIEYEPHSNKISSIYFYQAPYWIYVEGIKISEIESIPDFYSNTHELEVFDLR